MLSAADTWFVVPCEVVLFDGDANSRAVRGNWSFRLPIVLYPKIQEAPGVQQRVWFAERPSCVLMAVKIDCIPDAATLDEWMATLGNAIPELQEKFRIVRSHASTAGLGGTLISS